MGDAENDTVLSIAALGRSFRLGMLYDSRTETLVPGITLWDEATLKNRTEQQQQTSEFHVRCSDSLDDKASALDVAASLKLSILGGLLQAEGAAKYLDNRKTSEHQERVTLQYKCTTRVESMTMEQLGQGKIEHPEVFDHGTATHVVTSIVYGAQAFFIRGGGKEERYLLELFTKIRQSPISVLALRSWLEAKDTQISVLNEQISDDYKLPSAPEKMKELVADKKHDSVTVSWSPPEYGASTITSYVVSCCKDSIQQVILKVTDLDKNQATVSGLAANTEYEVRVCASCEAGDGPFGDKAPTCVADGCSVQQYIIKQETKPGHWEESLRIPSNNLSCKVETTKTNPSYKLAACCGSAGLTCDSEACTIDLAKQNTCENLKQYVCANSTLIPSDIRIYKPTLQLVYSDLKNNLEKYEFGERRFNVPERVIMLVGATGSGKTTLINGMINYIFGIQWKDTFRFKLITEPNAHKQSKSQTTKITSYTLHHMEGFKISYTLTIVDTPGFGDTSGIERDREITETIRRFFQTPGTNGINHIDAIGLVVNSSLARLTGPQKYIFDQILSVFAKDIADNIFLLLTFADGNDPQALSAIKEDKIPHQAYFKFNNSALYTFQSEERQGADYDSDDEGFNEMFWKMGVKSFVKFLHQLKTVESKSLTLTQDVLNERSALQTSIEGIQVDIRNGLSTLERLRKEMAILEDHKADITRNKDFEYEVEEEVQVQVRTPVAHYVTNCLHCNRTCHADCAFADDKDKIRCSAMKPNGYCKICPNECFWELHRNMPYKYETQLRKTKKTYSELRDKYEKATREKLSAEKLVEEINGEFDALQIKVLWMTDCVRKSLQRLKEIALRPSPMSTVEYVDVLIESEKSEARQGWQARVDQLRKVRKEAEQMEKIANDGFDPFGQYIENLPSGNRRQQNPVRRKATRQGISSLWAVDEGGCVAGAPDSPVLCVSQDALEAKVAV
ncbi:hypothetical protein O3P69_018749 [Scylla paramamosain]|uniref:Fibronectin type-III domain-containing protein n=1 Tax=Scylla paramamosain TaxID=85552 RepID=A0AAW0SRS6_SCYPA